MCLPWYNRTMSDTPSTVVSLWLPASLHRSLLIGLDMAMGWLGNDLRPFRSLLDTELVGGKSMARLRASRNQDVLYDVSPTDWSLSMEPLLMEMSEWCNDIPCGHRYSPQQLCNQDGVSADGAPMLPALPALLAWRQSMACAQEYPRKAPFWSWLWLANGAKVSHADTAAVLSKKLHRAPEQNGVLWSIEPALLSTHHHLSRALDVYTRVLINQWRALAEWSIWSRYDFRNEMDHREIDRCVWKLQNLCGTGSRSWAHPNLHPSVTGVTLLVQHVERVWWWQQGQHQKKHAEPKSMADTHMLPRVQHREVIDGGEVQVRALLQECSYPVHATSNGYCLEVEDLLHADARVGERVMVNMVPHPRMLAMGAHSQNWELAV